MNKYMTREEGKVKALKMWKEAREEFFKHCMEWKEETPAYINACKKVEEAKRMCNTYGVRI